MTTGEEIVNWSDARDSVSPRIHNQNCRDAALAAKIDLAIATCRSQTIRDCAELLAKYEWRTGTTDDPPESGERIEIGKFFVERIFNLNRPTQKT